MQKTLHVRYTTEFRRILRINNGTEIIPLNWINRSIFVVEAWRVFFAVRGENHLQEFTRTLI